MAAFPVLLDTQVFELARTAAQYTSSQRQDTDARQDVSNAAAPGMPLGGCGPGRSQGTSAAQQAAEATIPSAPAGDAETTGVTGNRSAKPRPALVCHRLLQPQAHVDDHAPDPPCNSPDSSFAQKQAPRAPTPTRAAGLQTPHSQGERLVPAVRGLRPVLPGTAAGSTDRDTEAHWVPTWLHAATVSEPGAVSEPVHVSHPSGSCSASELYMDLHGASLLCSSSPPPPSPSQRVRHTGRVRPLYAGHLRGARTARLRRNSSGSGGGRSNSMQQPPGSPRLMHRMAAFEARPAEQGANSPCETLLAHAPFSNPLYYTSGTGEEADGFQEPQFGGVLPASLACSITDRNQGQSQTQALADVQAHNSTSPPPQGFGRSRSFARSRLGRVSMGGSSTFHLSPLDASPSPDVHGSQKLGLPGAPKSPIATSAAQFLLNSLPSSSFLPTSNGRVGMPRSRSSDTFNVAQPFEEVQLPARPHTCHQVPDIHAMGLALHSR